jgi:nickel-dependent lactate racemase
LAFEFNPSFLLAPACIQMTRIDLSYGQALQTLECDEARFEVLTKASYQPAPLRDIEIGAALDASISSPTLDEILSPGESVLIVVSDATRATASAQIVNLLVRRIIQNGIAPSDIAIVFATGIHRSVTPAEKQQLLTPFIVQRVRTIDHDAHGAGTIVSYGTTAGGTPIELNRALKEFTHVIITGGIAFHYFAGFTGGRKSICPGLASERTIRQTHMLALDFAREDRRAGVGTGCLEGNAVHEECEQIAAAVSPAFSVNAVVDERGRALRVYAGHWREAHLQGCREYLVDHSLPIRSKREVVIASCGGAPYDINLIQAHKSLDMASQACADGGTIILLAECREGLGRPDFLKWFDVKDSGELAVRLREEYEVNGQTAWALLSKSEKYRVVLISELPEQQVKQLGMVPAGSLEEALLSVDRMAEGYILPRGAAFLPVVQS